MIDKQILIYSTKLAAFIEAALLFLSLLPIYDSHTGVLLRPLLHLIGYLVLSPISSFLHAQPSWLQMTLAAATQMIVLLVVIYPIELSYSVKSGKRRSYKLFS